MTVFPLELFARLMHSAPLYPATNVWRAVELNVLIERAMPRLREARDILDLGCGNGRMMAVLRPYLPPYASLTGIDADPLEARAADQLGVFEKVVCGQGEDMPFENASFDVVIANSVLEHIGPIRTVLEEVSRVLKPGGLFIMTVPGPNFHACLCGPDESSCRAYFETLDNRLIHLRYWTLAQWLERLLPIKLSLIDSHEYLNEAEAQRWHTLSRLTGGAVFLLTGRRKVHALTCGLHRSCNLSSALPRWVRLLSRIMLTRFKEPEEPSLFGCLMLIARRDPDPYERGPEA